MRNNLVIGSGNSSRAILLRVRNVPQLVAAQSKAGAFLQQLAPDTIEAQVYSTIKDELSSAMKEKGVDADVQIVSGSGYSPAPDSSLLTTVLVGLGGVAVGAFAMRMLKGRK